MWTSSLLTFSQCLLWLSSIHLLSFALLSSVPLTMPPQAADTQPCSHIACLWEGGSPGPQAGVFWGRNFWASALPPPCTNALGTSPLPRAHIWPECSVFLAVNCLLLPLGIFSGFGFMSVYFSWGIRRRMAAQSFLRLSEAIERSPGQCCQ